MAPPQAPPLTDLIALAIRLVNANQPARARIVCEQALATFAPHPAVHQLLAVLDLQDGRLASAREHAARSLALRPDHALATPGTGRLWLDLDGLRAELRAQAA